MHSLYKHNSYKHNEAEKPSKFMRILSMSPVSRPLIIELDKIGLVLYEVCKFKYFCKIKITHYMEKYTHRLNIQLAQFVSGIFEIFKILNPSQIHLMVIKKNERMCKQKKNIF